MDDTPVTLCASLPLSKTRSYMTYTYAFQRRETHKGSENHMPTKTTPTTLHLREPLLGAVQAQGRHAAERVPSDLGDAEMGDACKARLAWLAIRVIIWTVICDSPSARRKRSRHCKTR